MKTKLLITGLAIMTMTTFASAKNREPGQRQMNGTGKGSAFTDSNRNGICYNYENRTSNFTAGTGNNYCRGFGGGMKQGRGKGSGHPGIKQGRGHQKYFVDANKNGICDLRETPAKK